MAVRQISLAAAEHVVDKMAQAVALLATGQLDLAQTLITSLDLHALEHVRRTRLSAARAARRPVATAPGTPVGGRRSNMRLKFGIFERDAWICRFCGARTIDLRVLVAVSNLCPSEFPFHPNWKFGASHMLYWTHSSSLEHVVPFARGGADDVTNFVTTCYACNDARRDLLLNEIGWKLRDSASSQSQWRGLTEYLPRLASRP